MTHARIVLHVLRWLIAAFAVLAAAEAAAGAEVKGRVVDPDAKAVKGAKIYLVQSNGEEKIITQPVLSDGEGQFALKPEQELNGKFVVRDVVAVGGGFGGGGGWGGGGGGR